MPQRVGAYPGNLVVFHLAEVEELVVEFRQVAGHAGQGQGKVVGKGAHLPLLSAMVDDDGDDEVEPPAFFQLFLVDVAEVAQQLQMDVLRHEALVLQQEAHRDAPAGSFPAAGIDHVGEMALQLLVHVGVRVAVESSEVEPPADVGRQELLQEGQGLGGDGEDGLEEVVVGAEGHGAWFSGP